TNCWKGTLVEVGAQSAAVGGRGGGGGPGAWSGWGGEAVAGRGRAEPFQKTREECPTGRHRQCLNGSRCRFAPCRETPNRTIRNTSGLWGRRFEEKSSRFSSVPTPARPRASVAPQRAKTLSGSRHSDSSHERATSV